MNWKRIASGAVGAAVIIFGIDFVVNEFLLKNLWAYLQFQGLVKSAAWYAIPLQILQSLGIGFFLIWFYALVRPRFGPGPKTALLIGSIVAFLVYVPSSINQWLWLQLPGSLSAYAVIAGFVECWIAAYVAGWQYIESAP